MSEQFETGHARNLAAFQTIISYCSSYGATYNPMQTNLQLANLQTQLTNAETALTEAKKKQVAFTNATNTRAENFQPLKTMAMRIIYALAAAGVSPKTLDSAKTIKRKIVGKRVSKINEEQSPEVNIEKQNSASQQSFDQILSAFNTLIELAETQASYQPSETDLQIAQLKTYANTLKTANSVVITAKTDWAASRTERNKLLYAPQTGIVDTAQQIKNYVRSIYGPSDSEYKKVSGIELKGIDI